MTVSQVISARGSSTLLGNYSGGTSSITDARQAVASVSGARQAVASVSDARQAVAIVSGARQGVSENRGGTTRAALETDDGSKVKIKEQKKEDGRNENSVKEGVGEKVTALEKDIELLQKKKMNRDNLKNEILVKKREHMEEQMKVLNKAKEIREKEDEFAKFETDIGAKLEQKQKELKKVLEEAVNPGRLIKFLVDSIDEKAASLECPVCLEEAGPIVLRSLNLTNFLSCIV